MTIDDISHLSGQWLRSVDIHELLPQQEPFVVVDRLVHLDEVRTITETLISEDNLFVDGGSLSACGLMENVAQTCAARIGFVNKYLLNSGIQIGVIGAIRNLEILSLPSVGETITTIVDTLNEVFGMTLARAEVRRDHELLLSAEIKIGIREAGI